MEIKKEWLEQELLKLSKDLKKSLTPEKILEKAGDLGKKLKMSEEELNKRYEKIIKIVDDVQIEVIEMDEETIKHLVLETCANTLVDTVYGRIQKQFVADMFESLAKKIKE